jgi:hypothetical protein
MRKTKRRKPRNVNWLTVRTQSPSYGYCVLRELPPKLPPRMRGGIFHPARIRITARYANTSAGPSVMPGPT